MQALMDLAATNIPSAVNNGLSAYGRYRNSESLDMLTDANINSAISMGSIGARPALAGNTGPTSTTYRRLDPSFLHQGEAGKVAAEFERQTGMSRNDFLTQLSSISEQKIRKSDPMLFDKALSRLEGFVGKIPNQKFRNNLQKNINLVPNTLRKGLVAQAVAKFTGLLAGGGSPSSTISEPGAAAQAATKANGGERNPASGAEAGNDAKKGGESALAGSAPAFANGAGAGRDGRVPLDTIVRAAIESSTSQAGQSDEFTIFQQVSRRYRLLTPGLTHNL
jgi:hypothetical protein